jgi:MFS family permease
MSSSSPDLEGSQKWVLWSTRRTIDEEVPSLSAIVETAVAIPLYWWIAVRLETYNLLVAAVVIAPLILLRSDQSVSLGVQWFTNWEHNIWTSDRPYRQLHAGERRMFIFTLLSAATSSALVAAAASYFLQRAFFSDVAGLGGFLFGFAMGGTGALIGTAIAALGAFSRMGSWTTVNAFSGATALAGSILGAKLQIGGAISVWGFGEREGIAWGALASAILSIGIFVLVVSWIVRVGATFVFIKAGLRSMPRNFRQLIFCTSPLQEPELVPGLKTGTTRFTLMDLLEGIEQGLHGPISMKIFVSTIVPLTMLIWFLPAWLYRITLKSTIWFWWPLVYLGSELERAKNPEEFRRKIMGSLWAKTNLGLAGVTILTFVMINFLGTGAIFRENPLLTVLGYFLVVDRPLFPWQVLTIVVATLTFILVFWLDDVYGEHKNAKSLNQTQLVGAAERKFGWIERISRLRFVLVITLWLLVGAQALLYFNSQNCWSEIPPNAERWAAWAYGPKLPPKSCAEGKG